MAELQGQWRPPQLGDSRTDEAFRITFDYLYQLRGLHVDNVAAIEQVSASTQNVTQQVTQIISGNGSSSSFPPVNFGVHAARLIANAGSYNSTMWVETDRFNALYSSNGAQWALVAGAATGSFENRYTGLNAQDVGFFYIETGRVYRWNGSSWDYLAGCFGRNQNQLTTLAATFAANNSNNGNDIGAQVNVLDYHHQLQWTSANSGSFDWGPQDDLRAGEGPIFREVDPSPTTGWHLYDGANNVTYMLPTGNTATVATLANLSGNGAGNTAFIEAGAVNTGINAPVAPVFTGNAVTGSIAANFTGNAVTGSVASTFTGDAVTGSVAATFTGNGITFTTDVAAAGAITVLTGPTTITPSGSIAANFTGNAATGSVAATFTGNNATGTISNNGVPPNIVRRAWFRQ